MANLPLTPEGQIALLMRGVEFGAARIRQQMQQELVERLAESARTGVPLKVYLGVDPTSGALHLGHTVPLRKLRQFQDLGQGYFSDRFFHSPHRRPIGQGQSPPTTDTRAGRGPRAHLCCSGVQGAGRRTHHRRVQ